MGRINPVYRIRYSNSEDDVDLNVAESEKSKMTLETVVTREDNVLDSASMINNLESPGRRD